MKRLLALILMLLVLATTFSYAVLADESPVTNNVLVNVAVKAKISYGGTLSSGSANDLVDNFTDAYSSTALVLSANDDAYLKFDLGSEYVIKKFDVTNDFRANAYTISGSVDDSIYEKIADITSTSNSAYVVATDTYNNSAYRQSWEVNNAKAYRYYKITASQTAVMKFYDVQMWSECNVLSNGYIKNTIKYDANTQLLSAKKANGDAVAITNPDRIADGNKDNYEQPAAACNELVYDLGKVYSLVNFNIYYQGRDKNFYVYGSKDDNNYELMYLAKTSGNGSADSTGDIALDGREYRYIKFCRDAGENVVMLIHEAVLEYREKDPAVLDSDEYWFNAALGTAEKNVVTDGKDWGNGPVERITDGNNNNYGVAANTSYVILDLGDTYTLGGYDFKCSYRGSGYTLYGSSSESMPAKDDTSWVKLADLTQTASGSNVDYSQNGYFTHSDYRYVKLQTANKGVFKVYELEVKAVGKDKTDSKSIACKKYDYSYTVASGNASNATATATYDIALDDGDYVNAIRVAYGKRKGTYTVYGSEDGTNYEALYTYSVADEGENSDKVDTDKIYVRPGYYKSIKIKATNYSLAVIVLHEVEVFAKESGFVKNEYADNKWSISYNNKRNAAFTFVPIIAYYTDSDCKQLLSVTYPDNPVSVNANSVADSEYPITLPNGAVCAKLFLWNDFSGIVPLDESVVAD